MEAQLPTREGSRPLSLFGVWGLGLMSLLMYLSGLLVWLTPLPLLYAYRRARGSKALVGILLPVAILAAIYGALLPFATERLGAEGTLKLFFWVPGLGLGPAAESWNPAVFGIAYFLFFALIGVLLGEFEAQPYSMTRLVGQTAAIVFLSLVLWMAFYTWGAWGDFVRGLEGYFVKMLEEITKATPADDEMQVQWALLKDHAAGIAYYAVRLLPAMVFNLLLFVLWLNIVVARRLFAAWGGVFPFLGALKNWRLPFAGVWVVIAFAFLWIVDAYVLKTDWLKVAALNVFIVFALVYFFQGLAIVAFYLNRWSLSPMIRLVLYAVLLLFFQPLSFLLVAFGFFDSWFDFRKLVPKST